VKENSNFEQYGVSTKIGLENQVAKISAAKTMPSHLGP